MRRVVFVPRELGHLGTRIDLHTLDVLRRWIGKGEEGGNNRGSWVSRITDGRVGAWCAALQYSALEIACKELGLRPPFERTRQTYTARGLLRMYRSHGRDVPVEDCRPGDYLCLRRGRLPWQGHAQRLSDGAWPHVSVIDGNVGSYSRTRGRVMEIDVDLRGASVVGVARMG